MEFLTLNSKGVLLALLFACLFFVFGGRLAFYFLLAMVLFLIFSALATYIGYKSKKRQGFAQKPRGIKNVLANGLPPLIMVMFFWYFGKVGNATFSMLSMMGFFASVAAITSDKFSSEIGVLDGTPIMLLTFKRVKKGTSGGITWLGSLAGLLGAFLISLLILIIPKPFLPVGVSPFPTAIAIISITAAGFLGGMIDSVLGYFESQEIGNKFTSNFVCGIGGAVIAMLIFIVI